MLLTLYHSMNNNHLLVIQMRKHIYLQFYLFTQTHFLHNIQLQDLVILTFKVTIVKKNTFAEYLIINKSEIINLRVNQPQSQQDCVGGPNSTELNYGPRRS